MNAVAAATRPARGGGTRPDDSGMYPVFRDSTITPAARPRDSTARSWPQRAARGDRNREYFKATICFFRGGLNLYPRQVCMGFATENPDGPPGLKGGTQ